MRALFLALILLPTCGCAMTGADAYCAKVRQKQVQGAVDWANREAEAAQAAGDVNIDIVPSPEYMLTERELRRCAGKLLTDSPAGTAH